MKFKLLLKKIWEWSLNHFFKTFVILLLLNLILFRFIDTVPWILAIISFIALTCYVIFFMITRIKHQINKLLHHELKFKEIISGYSTSVIFMVLLFGILYSSMALLGVGYLRYGSCVDTSELSRSIIAQDPLAVSIFAHEVYFSAITFFTVGYGDICPMGADKIIAVLNAIIGNAFTVIVLSIAITNYSANKLNGDKFDTKSDTKVETKPVDDKNNK